MLIHLKIVIFDSLIRLEGEKMSDYNQKLLKHFLNPRNVGVIDNPDGYARIENPINGYTTDMYIKIEDGYIQDIKFKTFGCTVTIASASALTDLMKGKNLKEIVNNRKYLVTIFELMRGELGDIPEKNWHCLPTSILTLYTAILDYYNRKNDEKKIVQIKKILNDINNYFIAKQKEFET